MEIRHRSQFKGGERKEKMDQFRIFKNLTQIFSYLLVLLWASLSWGIPNGGYSRPELLIQPEELKGLIDRKDPHIRIIDVREKVKYLSGHIPGAINIWRPDITDKDHPIPGMMAPQTQIEELMGRLGINLKHTLILYSDGPDAARLWWILAYYGFPVVQMKLLDGHIEGWKAKGYPTEMIPPQVTPFPFKLPGKTKSTEPLLCALPEVKEALKDTKKVVLDVRASKEYLGEEKLSGALRAGRIPGVKWIEWKEVLIKDGPYKGYWKSAEEIRKLFSDLGVTPDKDIYIY